MRAAQSPVCSISNHPTGEKISGKFVITYGDDTEVLELIEEPFDTVALAVEHKIARSGVLRFRPSSKPTSHQSLGN